MRFRVWRSGCRGAAAASRVTLVTGDRVYRSSLLAVGEAAATAVAEVYSRDPYAPLRGAEEARRVLAAARGGAVAVASPWARVLAGDGGARLLRLRGLARSGYMLRGGVGEAYTLRLLSRSPPRVATGFATSRGPRRSNEDSLLVAVLRSCPGPRLHMVFLADGAGGLSYGQLASMVGVVVAHARLVARLPAGPLLGRVLAEASREASAAVAGEARRLGRAAASTLAAYVVDEDNMVVAHANVGDTSIHLVQAGRAEELSTLHRHVAPGGRHALSSYLGMDEPRVDSGVIPRLRGRFHLVALTDGVHEHVSEREIASIVERLPPRSAAERLVRLAEERGSRDNMTAVVTRVDW